MITTKQREQGEELGRQMTYHTLSMREGFERGEKYTIEEIGSYVRVTFGYFKLDEKTLLDLYANYAEGKPSRVEIPELNLRGSAYFQRFCFSLERDFPSPTSPFRAWMSASVSIDRQGLRKGPAVVICKPCDHEKATRILEATEGQ